MKTAMKSADRNGAARPTGVAGAFAVALGLATLVSCAAGAACLAPALPPDLAALRDQLAKYRDPIAAVHDGYLSTLGCVRYQDGAMGVHFLNPAFISPEVDPARPQILVYEPVGGRLELVAAEWFVPLATGVTQRPSLFGRPFDGPMAGHEPLMPQTLHHYDLHVWLFKENPAGTFAPINPNVSCDGYAYDFLEQPPAGVAHHGAH